MPAPDLISLASAYWYSSALSAAVSLGLFEALSSRSCTAADLAGDLECSERHLEALLHALAGMEVLVFKEDRFEVHPDLVSVLDPASPDCMLGALAFNQDLAGLWLRLPDCVREGAPVMPHNPHLGQDPSRTRRFVEGMHSRAGLMARGLLPCLVPESGSRILDAGGGPGTFSVKLAERDPSLNITILDLPPVVTAAEEIHAGHPALECLTFQGGDYHTAEFPDGLDLVLYCGAMHQEPEKDALALFRRFFQALRPGGELVVVDLMLDATRTQPAYSALFEINMMLMRPQSRVHAVPAVQKLLAEAGFEETAKASDVPGTPYHMVRALKPAGA